MAVTTSPRPRDGQPVEHVLELPPGVTLPPGVDELVARPSARRRRTASLTVQDGRLVMLVPAGLNLARETELARILLERLARRRAKQVQTRSDEALMARALQLRDSYLPQVPVPAQVRWSGDQITRWGSCTSADASIRISTQLCAMPQWVIDHVLMHEMVHLVHADHGTGFHELLAACPFTERARGFLEGWAMATSTPPDGGQDLLPGS